MICKKENCTGCFACYNICPQNAIEMKEDEFGAIYPEIIKEKCINCKLCEKICPQLKELKYNEPKKVFAMYSKDKKIREESTSGGAATLFYTSILEDNGVGYGVDNIDCGGKFNFIRITNKEQLKRVKGSKYVHCYVNNNYSKVKEDLENGKKVIFIGTPCQVSGLKEFLRKTYENLYLVDLICHGVPTQKFLHEQLELCKIDEKKIKKITFRNSSGYMLSVYDVDDKLIYNEYSDGIPYCREFLKGTIFRENCYNCKYARQERVSDITIGDFWGLDKTSKIYDDEKKGINQIIINTSKGMELLNKVKDKMILEERTIEEAKQKNGQLNSPCNKNAENLKIKENYLKYGYKKAMNKQKRLKDIFRESKLYYILRSIKHYINSRKNSN